MKKLFSLFLSLTLIGSLLTGCGGNGDTAQSSGNDSSSAASGGAAGSYIITLAHATAEETSAQAFALAFQEYVQDASEGAIVVNLYPNGQLGSDREVLEAIQNNEVTMTVTANAVQANFVTDAFVLDIPFTFTNLAAMRYTLSDPTFVVPMQASYDAANLRLLGYTDANFRVLSCNKEVHSPDDLKGMSIRTMENEYHLAAWKAMGANPTPLAFTELYTALQQGTVEGQENPIELIVSQKFYEQQDYVVLTNHLGQVAPWVMSKTFYDSLPAELQSVIDDGFVVGQVAAFDYVDSNTALQTQAIIDSGTEIIELTPEELSKFSACTQEVNGMIKETVSAVIYDAFMASCDSYTG